MNESYINMVQIFQKMAELYGNMGNMTGGGTGNAWYVNKNGKAPSQAQVGDIVYTKGGTYQITGKDENGKFTSNKIDDKSTNITDGMWGTSAGSIRNSSNNALNGSLDANTLSNKQIIDSANKQIASIRNNILGMEGVSRSLIENTDFTEAEIETLLKQMGITELNTTSLNGNIDALGWNSDELGDNTSGL